mmetsp:Transcript_27063/g.59155  ORF Transcript_27063/g.59155 Transcript_27063/m.59155 type:complete len:311 (+) Transcript_27063:1380-2312(+)
MGASSLCHTQVMMRPSAPSVTRRYAWLRLPYLLYSVILYCQTMVQMGSLCRRSATASVLERCMSPSRLRSHTYRSPLNVPPAMSAGWSGWKAQAMRQLSTSMRVSGFDWSRALRATFQVARAPRSVHQPTTSYLPYAAATVLPDALHDTHVTTSFLGLCSSLARWPVPRGWPPRGSMADREPSWGKAVSSNRQVGGSCSSSATLTNESSTSCSSTALVISVDSRPSTLDTKSDSPACDALECFGAAWSAESVWVAMIRLSVVWSPTEYISSWSVIIPVLLLCGMEACHVDCKLIKDSRGLASEKSKPLSS